MKLIENDVTFQILEQMFKFRNNNFILHSGKVNIDLMLHLV